ncbi:MAG: apolipoprotein N-acyltransferase [Alphaproteobacteria bacterium]|nr:apolipoprotein N-acyltransferase [Alphaproteobacteria bacterium]
MRVFVNYEDSRWKKYKIDFEKIVNATVPGKYKNSEVSITLVDDAAIKKINNKYRKINKPTNVLSFELGDDVLLGDIFISVDTVKREANSEGISVPEHTAHMIVHGVLHLLGYDHLNDKDAEKMEKKETSILKKLGYKNPYSPEFGVCSDESCCPGGKFVMKLKKFFYGAFGRTVLYSLFAIIASFGFAPFNLWWLTVLGIGGAYLLSLKSLVGISCWRKFWRIFPFGAVYAMVMFWWVLNSIYVVPELANQFAIWTLPGILGIGLVGGFVFTPPFLAISAKQLNPACRPFLFASVWTLVLWLREWLFTGFPWNPIANISLQNLYIANSMSLYGALGLTFVVVGTIAAICEIIRNYRLGLNWFVLMCFLVFGVVGGVYGIKNVRVVQNYCDKAQSPIIRIIQPAQSATQKATHSRAVALQNANHNLNVMTEIASAEGENDLIIFPETAYPFVMMPGDVISMARVLDKPIIIGANYFDDGKLYNSMLVVQPDATVSNVYSKSHLVPFGEYRPFGDLIPTPGLLTPGSGPELITMNLSNGKFVFAPAICYEIIFSDSLIPNAQTPNAIVNITNDNWFGKTPGTYQHLDMVRRYAIESGVPIVRANYSGISAFVESDGNVKAMIPIGVSGHIDGGVCGAHRTVYRKLGRDMWMIIILVFSCLGAIWVSGVTRKK